MTIQSQKKESCISYTLISKLLLICVGACAIYGNFVFHSNFSCAQENERIMDVPVISSESTSVGIYSSAFRQSYGLFDDISEPMWNLMKSRHEATSIYGDPKNPLRGVDNEIGWLQNNMWPNFNCPHMERVGTGEGRKFVCYPHRMVRDVKEKLKDDSQTNTSKKESNCLVYSIGCAGNFAFEDTISQRFNKECEVHVFDPANWTRKDDIPNRNIHYHPWGMKSTYDDKGRSRVWPKGQGGDFKTFPETIKLLGHENRIIDLFKIDCEGCEWFTYKDWIGFGMRQIVMETHGVPLPDGRKGSRFHKQSLNITDYFQDFSDNGYVLYSRDHNNGGPGMELGFLKLSPDFQKVSPD